MNDVYALTPTGYRPEGLALLGEYLSAQTYDGPLTWIVVDDCDPVTRIPDVRENIHVIPVRPSWRWNGQNTQAKCLTAGLHCVPEDATLLICEDDDCYLPAHIENILSALEANELAGERVARYYHVQSLRYREIPSPRHASLCSVGMKGDALKAFRAICDRIVKPLDVTLWRECKGVLLDTANVIGIKGLPGRPGIGVGHRKTFGTPDTTGVLQRWLGDYADNYGIFRA